MTLTNEQVIKLIDYFDKGMKCMYCRDRIDAMDYMKTDCAECVNHNKFKLRYQIRDSLNELLEEK